MKDCAGGEVEAGPGEKWYIGSDGAFSGVIGREDEVGFQRKLNSDGSICALKVRLVMQGLSQVNYDSQVFETHAPVARMSFPASYV